MTITRRDFLKTSGLLSGGLVIGYHLTGCSAQPVPNSIPGALQPNAWLQITEDNRIIFQLDKVEMGQGVSTAMPTILAEELEVSPDAIEVEFAGVHHDFKNRAMGTQMTGGSTSITSSYEPLLQAGAIARELMLNAAAKKWQVDKSQLKAQDGTVIYAAQNKVATYGELVPIAKTLSVPSKAPLKDPAQFRWIGKSIKKRDTLEKSTGAAVFGIDVDIPDALTAVVVRCPHFGGKVQSYDATKTRSHAGVVEVLQIPSGIAVVAKGYWQARSAAKDLQIIWDKGPLAGLDSEKISAVQHEKLDAEDVYSITSRGDAEKILLNADRKMTAEFDSPFLHHSPMEPQNCTAVVTNNRCDIWAPNQGPDVLRGVVSEYTGLPYEAINVHTTYLGGGFGRRSYPDFAAEAAVIAQRMAKPIKVIWSREDDMQHDYYRPKTYHRVTASLDKDGKLDAWHHRVVAPSLMKDFAPDMFVGMLPTWVPRAVARGVGRFAGNIMADSPYDPTTMEGTEIPYRVANFSTDTVYHDPGVPIGFWRSVGNSHSAFVVESFIDELAASAGTDPVEFRKQHLVDQPRLLNVLQLVAEKAVWGKPKYANAAQGAASHFSFKTYVAQIAEVELDGNNQFKVKRIVCAVDCGRVINPEIVKAQVESAIIYGLTAALKDPITIKDGAVVQSNFHDAQVLRFDETPEIEVHIVESSEPPTGIGEPGLPPVAPAVANAVFRLTGKRLRNIPLRLL